MKKLMMLVLVMAAAMAQAVVDCRGGVTKVASAPLFTTDPMFSLWAPKGELNGGMLRHWSDEPQNLRATLTVDGVGYRLAGSAADGHAQTPAAQESLEVGATRTRFQLAAGPVEAVLTFFTPLIADDLDVLSRPVSYLSCAFRSRDGKPHDLSLRVTLTGEFAAQHYQREGMAEEVSLAGAKDVRVGSRRQSPLCQVGDRLRPDWGYVHLASPDAARTLVPVRSHLRVCDISAGLEWEFPGVTSATAKVAAAYDDLVGLEFLRHECPGWWARDGKPFAAMLGEAVADFDRMDAKTAAFDARLRADAGRIGGADYAVLAQLAWRQSYAACKLVKGPDGEPLYFSKENGSGGFIGTVDVFYPQLPHLLLTSLPLVKATLKPILDYAATPEWKHDFAPHDLGLYPLANFQMYSWKGVDAPGTPAMMPVEECGNMLICLGALATAEKNADFASRWWPEVKKWAAYLERTGMDPENQLCTDDFAGHLAHNANLSAKTIVALAAYARMCEMRGEGEESARVGALAKQMVGEWQKKADGGAEGAYRLAFDRPGSWSMKYNLVWDRLLGFGLFPPEVAAREMAAYRKLVTAKENPFGLPLDSRPDPKDAKCQYTKGDWTVWCATLTGNREDFEALVAPMRRFVESSPSPVPLGDWYYTDNGEACDFRARSVVGGYFLPFLYDAGMVSRYRAR